MQATLSPSFVKLEFISVQIAKYPPLKLKTYTLPSTIISTLPPLTPHKTFIVSTIIFSLEISTAGWAYNKKNTSPTTRIPAYPNSNWRPLPSTPSPRQRPQFDVNYHQCPYQGQNTPRFPQPPHPHHCRRPLLLVPPKLHIRMWKIKKTKNPFSLHLPTTTHDTKVDFSIVSKLITPDITQCTTHFNCWHSLPPIYPTIADNPD